MARLPRDFYNGDTVELARSLLGRFLVRRLGDELLVGRITETEAYVGRCDRACHAFGYKRTPRTSVLFMEPGHAYLYLIYGMHHCLNFVTEPEGEPSAVLIRGIEPVAGAATMYRLRYGDKPLTPARQKSLSNGPGKVCQALHLTLAENKMDLTGNILFVCDCPEDVGLPPYEAAPERVCSGPRIGVDYAQEDRLLPWRFWLEKE